MRTQMAVYVAALVSTFFPCAAVAEPAQPTLKLSIVSGRPVVDGVFLNGRGPYRFLLDTGSQTNQVESGLARKLGLTATSQVELATPSGLSRVPCGRVSKVAFGGVEADDQEFLFNNFDSVHLLLAPDIRGILGQEFLSHFDYTLDFKHHQLTFGDLPAPGEHIAVSLIYGRMAVPTSEGELVLDSGAQMLFLYRKSSHAANAHVTSSTGLLVNVTVEHAPELRIGDRKYHPAQAEFQEVADAAEAGLLPVSLFQAIFVSNSGGYVVLDPELR